ncbi:MAG: fused MFS/spermidine synthase [Phycisphaerales bacterium]|nr:fused MFS/spermidine synthase [Phycisphaerales bacterium]
MLALYTAAAFLGAALLFIVEPFAARQALPSFGGSPAVWNTCVLFFQVGVLAGYLYAHLLTSRLRGRWQVALHSLVLALGAFAPLGLATEASGFETPAWDLLRLLAVGFGLPFFAVASAGPLLQRWLAETGHRRAPDPYFLYAASNAGSFIGLLAYPFVVERVWTLDQQAAWWRGGFVAFACLSLAAGLRIRKAATANCAAAPVPLGRAVWRERAAWTLLAFVPSSLMLGATQFISTDLAAAPLLWVIPLGLYLLTFVAAFGRWGARITPMAARAWPVLVVAIALAFMLRARSPLFAVVGLHLAVLMAAGCLCHGRLRATSPGVSRLTEFYICVAVGGALGGAFNSLLAPILFPDLYEYPIAIAMTCAALPISKGTLGWKRVAWLLPPALLAWVWMIAPRLPSELLGSHHLALLVGAGLPAIVLFLSSNRRRVFTAATLGVLGGSMLAAGGSHVEYRVRSFFGVHTVEIDESGRYRMLLHGTTAHGVEALDPDRRGEPLAYYARPGPAGQVFTMLGERFEHVGLVGVGAGSLGAYGREGQRFDFFDIDPAVVRIARDPRWFTFLPDCRAHTRFVIGDGRLSLANEPDHTFDLIVLDAFSSDAVPIHMLTREAVATYAAKLRPGGLLLFHLSNRNLALAPFVAAAAAEEGLTCRERRDEVTADQQAKTGRFASEWLVAGAGPEALAPLLRDVRWEEPTRARAPWTDAHADLAAALVWK